MTHSDPHSFLLWNVTKKSLEEMLIKFNFISIFLDHEIMNNNRLSNLAAKSFMRTYTLTNQIQELLSVEVKQFLDNAQ